MSRSGGSSRSRSRASWNVPVVTTVYPASPSISASPSRVPRWSSTMRIVAIDGRRAHSASSVVYKPYRYTLTRASNAENRSMIPSPMHRSAVIKPAPAVRPFLKWAGGKRQLLRELRRYVPREFPAYHEPFLGSGALFFDLWRSNRLHGTACQLGDANADLVGVYRALAENTENVIAHWPGERTPGWGRPPITMCATRSSTPSAAHVRTPRRQPIRPICGDVHLPESHGLQRPVPVEFAGDFNVPVGRYARPRICDEPTLPRRRRGAEITVGDAAPPNLHGRCQGSRSRGPWCISIRLRAAQRDGALYVAAGWQLFPRKTRRCRNW